MDMLDLLDPDILVRGMDPDPDPALDENDINVPSKCNTQKNFKI
jgi:hypothetical protein